MFLHPTIQGGIYKVDYSSKMYLNLRYMLDQLEGINANAISIESK